MRFVEIGEDFAIDLDKVLDMSIVGIENQNDLTKPKYIIIFTLNTIESVFIIPNKEIDEDEYESSHVQERNYTYMTRMSPEFKSYKEARECFEKLATGSIFKKETQNKKGESE